ncbi:MAG: DUF92 domain-containing protein [Candidatus Hydrothermarchaeales archaeon]
MKKNLEGRDVLHILVGFTAVFLKYLSRVKAIFAALVIFITIYLLAIPSKSQFFNVIAKSEDWRRGYARGPLFFGLVAVFLVVFFPLYLAAVCIVIMGFGDGFATVIGRRFGGSHVGWAKKEKTLEGALAFFIFASISSFFILILIKEAFPIINEASTIRLFLYAIITSFVGALVEILDITIDDNLSVPVSTAVTLHVLTLVSVGRLRALDPYLALQYVVICLILGYPTLKFHVLDEKGSVAAFFLGLITYLSLGFSGFMVLLSLHVIGAVTTRMGIKDKKKRRTEQEKIRSVDNILANGLVPVLGAFLYFAAKTNNNLFYVGFVGAIAAATADTTSSEIGQLSSKKPRLITTWKEVEIGTDGAITLLGNMAAISASIVVVIIALIFSISGIEQIPLIISVVIGGLIGTTIDSFLGATLEQSEIVGNNTVNLLATACSFFTVIAVYSIL